MFINNNTIDKMRVLFKIKIISLPSISCNVIDS